MAKNDFHDYVMQDVLGRIRGVSSRAMFGGHGIYKDGVVFAIIADGELYFKVDDSNRKDYEAAGSKPFAYSAKDRKLVTMSYWEVPASVMEDPDEVASWVERSVKVSREKNRSGKLTK